MAFIGKDELDMAPELLSGKEILLKLNGKKFTTGKTKKNSKLAQKARDAQNSQKVGDDWNFRKLEVLWIFELRHWRIFGRKGQHSLTLNIGKVCIYETA